MTDPVEYITADSTDPKIQIAAKAMLEDLQQSIGIGSTLALLNIALTLACLEMLHQKDCPMPEVNIAALHRLADALKTNIANHEPRAIKNGAKLPVQ